MYLILCEHLIYVILTLDSVICYDMFPVDSMTKHTSHVSVYLWHPGVLSYSHLFTCNRMTWHMLHALSWRVMTFYTDMWYTSFPGSWHYTPLCLCHRCVWKWIIFIEYMNYMNYNIWWNIYFVSSIVLCIYQSPRFCTKIFYWYFLPVLFLVVGRYSLKSLGWLY